MNYTKPENLNHKDDPKDDPKDWLNCALVFARALGILLKNDEGVVIETCGDMNFGEVKKLIVYSKGDQVHVVECEEHLPEGQMVMVD